VDTGEKGSAGRGGKRGDGLESWGEKRGKENKRIEQVGKKNQKIRKRKRRATMASKPKKSEIKAEMMRPLFK